MIQEWIQECQNAHPNCNTDNSSILPSRLIDVGGKHSPLLPHLVITEIGTSTIGPYCALSYCWGQTTIGVKAVGANLSMQCLQIDAGACPKTLHDAMIITRNLGVQYLWIDALCIIQDDPLDWEKESAKMASIFKNAYLTIAASSVADCNGGCFLNSLKPSRICKQVLGEPGSSSYCTTFVRSSVLASAPINSDPLNKRGWTLQETLLSTRVLHFTADQVFWQCRTRLTSEDGTHDRDLSALTLDNLNGKRLPWHAISTHKLRTDKDIYQTWYMTARNYSSRKLTYPSDKVAAFAGLTKYFQELNGDCSILGLWKKDIIRQLAWRAPDTVDVSRNDFLLSWSWLSMNTSCDPPAFEIGNNPTYAAEVVLADIQWSGESLTSTLKASRLVLKGRLCTMQIAYHDGRRYDTADDTHFQAVYIQPLNTPMGHFRTQLDPWVADPTDRTTTEYYFDENVWRKTPRGGRSRVFTPVGTGVITFLLLAEKNEEHNMELMLLLELFSKIPRVYRRIGVGVHIHRNYFRQDCDAMECFKDMKETFICLQ